MPPALSLGFSTFLDLGFSGAAGAAFSVLDGLDGGGVLSLSDLRRNLHLSPLVRCPFFQHMQALLIFFCLSGGFGDVDQ